MMPNIFTRSFVFTIVIKLLWLLSLEIIIIVFDWDVCGRSWRCGWTLCCRRCCCDGCRLVLIVVIVIVIILIVVIIIGGQYGGWSTVCC